MITVSIHAPRVGCDTSVDNQLSRAFVFQFTHPVWGATYRQMNEMQDKMFQFTHPVWGATAMPKGTHK